MSSKKPFSLATFWRHSSLSITLLGLFACMLIGMSIVGWRTTVNESHDRHQPSMSYGAYLVSGDFVEGVFENWESEFLQMWALVILTIWLKQKGADDSRPLRGAIDQDHDIPVKGGKKHALNRLKKFVYVHSLSLALLSIFVLSFALHAVGGATVYNDDSEYYHRSERVTPLTYIATSQFWYESLQNWQSEFLAVGMLMLLSIKLRERDSPQSKPLGRMYDAKTGI